MFFGEFFGIVVTIRTSQYAGFFSLMLGHYCRTQEGLQPQPSECGLQHTLISVHAQSAAWQQSNGNSETRMSEKYGEWRD